MINPSALKKAIVVWCLAIRTMVIAFAIWSLVYITAPDYMVTAAVKMAILVATFFYVYRKLAKSAANQFVNTLKINRMIAILWSFLAGFIIAWLFLPCPTCDEYAGQRAAIGFSVFALFALVHWVFHAQLKRFSPPQAR